MGGVAMKTPNENEKNKRISSLLSTVGRQAAGPDKPFLDGLQAKSTAEFLRCSAKGAERFGGAISIWRAIRQSRITKLAATALVMIAVMMIVNQFGGSVDLTTIAFADISEAMKKVPWMRMANRGFEGRIEGPIELLVGFEAKITASKDSTGKITFSDFGAHKSYQYDPENRAITIDYVYENDLPSHLSSAFSFLESMHKMLEARGAQVNTTESQYDGRRVQLQEISVAGMAPTVRLYIQPHSKLLLAAQVKVTDPNGNTAIDGEITFDYPQTGPADVYDLGVPRDAQIINRLPKEDYRKIWDNYRQRGMEVTRRYIAVTTRTNYLFGGVVTDVYADYKSDSNHRLEIHSVFGARELNQYDKFWPGYREQLGDSYESLLAWAGNHYDSGGRISVYLYDGQRNFSTSRDDRWRWGKLSKGASNRNHMPSDYLEWLGWPQIIATGHITEDDYAKENSLICVERLQQGSIYSGNVSLPGRFLYYLDPQKDFMCRRKVTEWRPGAEWQKDKSWLEGVDPQKVRDGSITVEDITEVIQATNGHWYPKVIVVKQSGIRKDYQDAPLQVTNTKTVYVQVEPEFPDGVFDPEKLPGR